MRTLSDILNSLTWLSGNMNLSPSSLLRLELMMSYDAITFVSITDNSGTSWIADPNAIKEVYGITPEVFKENSYRDLKQALKHFRKYSKEQPTQILSVYTFTPGDNSFFYVAIPGYGHNKDVIDMPRFAWM